MATRLLDRLKRSLFRDGQGVGPDQPGIVPDGGGQGGEPYPEDEDQWEAQLEEEEECVSDRLVGTLCFDGGGGGEEDGEGSGLDSDSDFLGESMEEVLSSTETSPGDVSPPSSSSQFTRQLQESWRNLRSPSSSSRAQSDSNVSCKSQADSLLFEVTDASVVQDGTSKYVLYTVHVSQSGGSDKTPAVITRRYSDFQRLHSTLRRHHGDHMERVCFPRKKLHRNFTAETIAKRSRAFEQYLYHLCSQSVLRKALSVRHFFYLADLHTGQLLIRVGRYHEAVGPLFNAKSLQLKLGWACCYGNQTHHQASNQTHHQANNQGQSTHWFYTLVALATCFQELEQLEEAQENCDHALQTLTPPPLDTPPTSTLLPSENNQLVPSTGHADRPRLHMHKPHPLLFPLLRLVVRLSWQTGRDKRRWEELLHQLEEEWAGLDNQSSIKEFLVKHNLQEGTEGEG